MNKRLSDRAREVFTAGLALVALAFAGMVYASHLYESDAWWVRHTFEVRATIAQALENLAEAPSLVPRLAEDICTLTRDNPKQQARCPALTSESAQADAHRSSVRALLEVMRREEITLQDQRDMRARHSLHRVWGAMAAGIGSALALLALAWAGMTKQIGSLKRSEMQMSMLLESTTDAVWSLDRELRVTRCNQRFAQIIDDLRGPGGFEGLMRGDYSFKDFADWRTAYEQVFAGERRTIEIERPSARGPKKWYLVTVDPVIVDGQVVSTVAIGRDISVRKRAELKLEQRAETLHYMSNNDEMTGVYNRRGFMEMGETLLRHATEQRLQVAILYADLDGLKRINDQQGHAAGDEAIKSAAQVLSDSVRAGDIVGRLGGDEFVILAATGDERPLVDRIDAALRKESLAMSIGVVTHDTAAGPRTLADLMSEADQLMYRRKSERKARAASENAAKIEVVASENGDGDGESSRR